MGCGIAKCFPQDDDGVLIRSELLSVMQLGLKNTIDFSDQDQLHDLFSNWLDILLKITKSKYGFIGRVFKDERGDPWLRTLATTNIAWDHATREFYQANYRRGFEFRNLKTLFGSVMTTHAVVISNDPSTDARSGGLPPGHPPLRRFLGVPIMFQERMLGMFGIANRTELYTMELVEQLSIFTSSMAMMINALNEKETRMRAELVLKHQTSLFSKLLHGAPVAILQLDSQGNVLESNRCWQKWVGHECSAQSAGGAHKLFDHCHDLNRETCLEKHHKSEPTRFNCSIGSLFLEGYRVDLEDIEEKLADGVGNVSSLCIILDVSDRKKNEEELRESKEKAEVAHNIKAKMLSAISHELRTPLYTMSMLTQGWRQGISNEHTHTEDLAVLEAVTEHMMSMVNDILDLHKLESGKVHLKPSVFNISRLFRSLERMFRSRLEQKGLNFVVDLPSDLPSVNADQQKLQQILINLLSNALKYTKKGSVSLACAVVPASGGETSSRGGGSRKPTPSTSLEHLNQHLSLPPDNRTSGQSVSMCPYLAASASSTPSPALSPAPARVTVDVSAEAKMQDNHIDSPSRLFLSINETCAAIDRVSRSPRCPAPKPTVPCIHLRFSIKDTGIGIREEDLPLVFEYLTRCSRDADESLKSTGIGLNLSQSVARLLGTSIHVSSRVGEGSTFWFDISLPIASTPGSVQSSPLDNNRTISHRGVNSSQRGLNTIAGACTKCPILLAEDNSINLKICHRMLNQILPESQIDDAVDGLQAVEKAAKREYHIILMDLQMPNMDGREATRIIRKNNPDVPIYAVTASADILLKDLVEDGFTGVVVKPFKMYDLQAVWAKHHTSSSESTAVGMVSVSLSKNSDTSASVATQRPIFFEVLV